MAAPITEREGERQMKNSEGNRRDLDESWLIVMRGLETMEVDDCRRNVGKPGIRKVLPECSPWRKPWTSDGDGDLQAGSVR